MSKLEFKCTSLALTLSLFLGHYADSQCSKALVSRALPPFLMHDILEGGNDMKNLGDTVT